MPDRAPLVPHKKLSLEFDVACLKSDLDRLTTNWQEHPNKIHYQGGWKALPLISAGGSATDILTPWGSDFAATPYLELCPYFQEIVDRFECPLLRVRLLRLESGAIIRRHIDQHHEGHYGFVRLHIPVVTNGGIEFYLNGDRLIMEPGSLWFTEVAFPHSVKNLSAEDRIHLVLDCDANEWLESLLGFSPQESRKDNQKSYDRIKRRYKSIDRYRRLASRSRSAMRMAIRDPIAFCVAVAREVKELTQTRS